MSKTPCKGCIIQSICTKSCGELLKYGYDVENNWSGEDCVRYQNYLNCRRIIVNRKYQNYLNCRRIIINRKYQIRLNKKEITI
jgi:hypothetical protein